MYEHLRRRIERQVGVVDHVGEDYSAYSFARETQAHGPSRRMTPRMARVIGEAIWDGGPVPIIFTHSRVPVFANAAEREVAMEYCRRCFNTDFDEEYHRTKATWRDPEWGPWAGQYFGEDHMMIPVLHLVDQLDNHWRAHRSMENWQEARAFFRSLRYVEQAFGVSWIVRVSYTMPTAGDSVAQEARDFPGLHVINLDLNSGLEET